MRLSLLPVWLLLSSICFAEVPDKKVGRLWRAKCSACHGVDGRGQTETGLRLKLPDFTTAAWQQKTTDDFIRNRVTRGISEMRDGVLKEMPAFAEELKPEHLDAIVAMLRGLAAPERGKPALTPAEG